MTKNNNIMQSGFHPLNGHIRSPEPSGIGSWPNVTLIRFERVEAASLSGLSSNWIWLVWNRRAEWYEFNRMWLSLDLPVDSLNVSFGGLVHPGEFGTDLASCHGFIKG